jgi:Protein of unknown function (DUF2730)
VTPVDFDWTVSLSFLLTVVAMIYAWWRTRDQNTDGRFKAGSERMDRHEARLNSMEQTMRGLPQKEDMHQLQLSVERMSGKLDTMSAVIDGNNKVMERLEDVVERQENYLLGQKK